MRLDIDGKASVESVTEKKIRSVITALRSYGPSSFASLVDTDGNYIQVAGGVITCALERREAATGRHFRAYHDTPSKIYPDGTSLMFGGGAVKLNANEWFTCAVAADAFCAFLRGEDWPASVQWRDISEMLA
ncbi:hypothetical protein [Duganella sp. S19_KUP01_CR8]|uniref:hypothetical protein n=1 Tax=Duganella sp. S19_KUP01_CR8 TaxID=3025502 RepID=UPI002FCDC2EA